MYLPSWSICKSDIRNIYIFCIMHSNQTSSHCWIYNWRKWHWNTTSGFISVRSFVITKSKSIPIYLTFSSNHYFFYVIRSIGRWLSFIVHTQIQQACMYIIIIRQHFRTIFPLRLTLWKFAPSLPSGDNHRIIFRVLCSHQYPIYLKSHIAFQKQSSCTENMIFR